MENLQDLFAHEVNDLYSAEKELLKALPKMARAANSEELSSAFEEHIGRTEEHVSRLETILRELDRPARGRCKGMEGLIAESDDVLSNDIAPHVLDAALIGTIQRAEHYGIAAYGTARAYAKRLRFDRVADTLQKMLDDQKALDKRLTLIAEGMANARAQRGAALMDIDESMDGDDDAMGDASDDGEMGSY